MQDTVAKPDTDTQLKTAEAGPKAAELQQKHATAQRGFVWLTDSNSLGFCEAELACSEKALQASVCLQVCLFCTLNVLSGCIILHTCGNQCWHCLQGVRDSGSGATLTSHAVAELKC